MRSISALKLGAKCSQLAQEPRLVQLVEPMKKNEKDLAAIRQLAQDWHRAWAAEDADAMVALFSDDPVVMPQGQRAVVGTGSIRSIYRSVFEEFTVEGSGELLEVEASGDWGFFWSTYKLTATPRAEGGDAIQDEGKSVFIVRRQPDGLWRIARLIANSDLPPESRSRP